MSQAQTREQAHTAHSPVDEAEQLDRMAGSENDALTVHDSNTAMATALADVPEAGSGTRIRRAFTMKNFLPSTNYLDWIMQNVTAKGTGTHVLVGRVYGMVHHAEDRETVWGQDKKTIRSIALAGDLQAEKDIDGEVITFDLLFLPMAFAAQIKRGLDASGGSVAIDVDIGIEATGKAIPYEWTVTSYLSGRAERALRNLRESRKIGGPSAAVIVEREQRMIAQQQDTAKESATAKVSSRRPA